MTRLTRCTMIATATVLIATVCAVLAPAPASAAPTAITVAAPLANQVIQRDVATNTADVAVSGSVNAAGPVEASLDGVTWTPLAVTGTTFAGVLEDEPVGRRDLVVRSTEAPSVSNTVAAVGVGDVFAVMGDSNAATPSPIPQAYAGPAGQVSMFTQAKIWRNVTGDPIDRADEDAPLANCQWVLFVCVHHALYDSYVGGSTWPRVATQLATAQPGLPIGLVVMARGGSGLDCDPAVMSPVCWQKPTGTWATDPFKSVYADALNRLRAMAPSGGVRAMVWFEGFNDTGAARVAWGRSEYLSRLNRFVSNLQADYGPLDVVVSSPGDCDLTLASKCLNIESGLDNARAAIADAWAGTPHVVRGPILYDVDKSSGAQPDGIHYRSQAALDTAADRLTGAVLAAYYGGPSQVGPQLLSAAGDEHSVRLTFDHAALVPGASVGGITVERDGVATPSTAVAVSDHEVDVALAGQDGALSVSVAAGRTGRQVGIVRDANGLPADVVLRTAVQRTDPDGVAPSGTVAVNGGAAQATSSMVNLGLTAADDRTPQSALEVQVSNAADLTGAVWQPFTASLPWTLDAGTGTRTVYARFRDAAGNVSPVSSDTIEVIAAPTGPVRYMGGIVNLQGGGAFSANVRPADFFGLRGTVYIGGAGYIQRNDVTRCGPSCVQGSAFALFRANQAWKVDLAAGTVTINGVTKAITAGTLTIL